MEEEEKMLRTQMKAQQNKESLLAAAENPGIPFTLNSNRGELGSGNGKALVQVIMPKRSKKGVESEAVGLAYPHPLFFITSPCIRALAQRRLRMGRHELIMGSDLDGSPHTSCRFAWTSLFYMSTIVAAIDSMNTATLCEQWQLTRQLT